MMRKSSRLAIFGLPIVIAILVAVPGMAVHGADGGRLAAAPDGVLFMIQDGARHRVTPQRMTFAELGAIPEGPPLTAGQLVPALIAAPRTETMGPIRPDTNLGLARDRPIPLGQTCSCAIDRAGSPSLFDITVGRVSQDASAQILAMNRFNRLPRDGHVYVGVFMQMAYIAGPEDQAYTITEADFRVAASDDALHDAMPLIYGDQTPRPRGDFYPGATLNGWLFFEVPRGRPVVLVWQHSFVGERGVWFALN